MDEREFKALDDKLASMSKRCDAVIARENLGKPMKILKPRPPKPQPKVTRQEADYTAPPMLEVRFPRGLRYRLEPEEPREPDIMDEIFADFNREFDEMAQAHKGLRR